MAWMEEVFPAGYFILTASTKLGGADRARRETNAHRFSRNRLKFQSVYG